MFTTHRQGRAIASACLGIVLSAVSSVHAITVMRDPMQGAGFVDVDLGPFPFILGAPVGTPLDYDVVFTDMQHIQLMTGATTTAEFSIGNTGNTADLDYHIVFDLSDMHGNLITTNALVLDSTAPAGFFQIVNLDLTPLPPVMFHDFHVRVETSFVGANTGSGLFDFFMAGGAGDFGTGASGPVRFNRAVVGQWIPEPASATMALLASALAAHRARAMRPRANK